jgi:hypothetical protein
MPSDLYSFGTLAHHPSVSLVEGSMPEFLEKLNPNVFFFGMFVVTGVGFAIALYFLREKS